MSIAPSALPPSPRPHVRRVRLSRRARWLLLGGFGFGLSMFLLLWLDMRNNGDFYRAEPRAEGKDGQVFDPLPTPMSNGERSISGLSEAAEEALRNPPPPPPKIEPAPEIAPERALADAGTVAERPNAVAGPDTQPVPISRPAPEYPADALRRNEAGTVLLTVAVNDAGQPTDVFIKRSSRSRSLDRAATQAARRWSFRPARRDGRPVAGEVEIPITFTLEGR